MVWKSPAWFPILVGTLSTLGAAVGARFGLPSRTKTPREAGIGIALVLVLYAVTALLRGHDPIVGVILCSALAVAIFLWWDPSVGALIAGAGAAVFGPLAEIALVRLEVFVYTEGSVSLLGVAPWLPCLYFAAGAVVAGLAVPMSRVDRSMQF